MRNPLIVVSGLPGSGKTTLARRLAPALNLPVIDKDDILERLFDSKGTGDVQFRRALSRESDMIFQREAASSDGAILVSFWRLPGMPDDSGTPIDWLRSLSPRVVNLQCNCEPDLAAMRFLKRKRHPGHLDSRGSYEEVLTNLRALARLGSLDLEPRVDVDTSRDLQLDEIVLDIRRALARCVTARSEKLS